MRCDRILLSMLFWIATGVSADDIPVRPAGIYPDTAPPECTLLVLTFDDGLMRDRTAGVLDALRQRGLSATFFVSGHTIHRNTWHLIDRMVAEGHQLANHSWTHDQRMASRQGRVAEHDDWLTSELVLTQIKVDLAILARSTAEYVALETEVFQGFRGKQPRDIQRARAPGIYARHRDVMTRHGYSQDEHPVRLHWFRPPGGSPFMGRQWTDEHRRTFTRSMIDADVKVAIWHHSVPDSLPEAPGNTSKLTARVRSVTQKAVAQGGVILAHDRLHGAPLAALLDPLVDARERLVTLDAFQDRCTNAGIFSETTR